jgi:hypothetical protein
MVEVRVPGKPTTSMLEAKMPNPPHDRTYWNATAPAPEFPPLAGDRRVDVAIIGAASSA